MRIHCLSWETKLIIVLPWELEFPLGVKIVEIFYYGPLKKEENSSIMNSCQSKESSLELSEPVLIPFNSMLELTGVRPSLGAEAGRLRWIETLVDSVRYGSLLVDANPLTDFAQWKVMANNPNSGKKIKPRWFPKAVVNFLFCISESRIALMVINNNSR